MNYSKIILPLFLCWSLCASHPHMFIDISANFMLSNNGLDGIYINWKFDEMNSAWMIDEYDENKNGAFEKNEISRIYKEGFSGSVKINYFTSLLIGKASYQFKEIKSFMPAISKDRLVTYSFFAVCKISLREINNQTIMVSFDDPTVYSVFELKKNNIKASSKNGVTGIISYSGKDFGENILLRISKK